MSGYKKMSRFSPLTHHSMTHTAPLNMEQEILAIFHYHAQFMKNAQFAHTYTCGFLTCRGKTNN